MNVIGIDFGTTNSILSYIDGGKLESYKMGGVEGNSYIPSFLAIEDEDVEIGMVAKELAATTSDVEVYSRFKMLLGEFDPKRLKQFGYSKDRTPQWATTQFLKKLIANYKREMRTSSIDKMVLTIPEIWQRDNLQARSALKKILEDLNHSSVKFVSEPAAAGAYFLDRYKQKKGNDFDGHFLVFDYGGGTLDVSLVETSNSKIKILERAGIGQSGEHLGKAGVAYDQYVVQKSVAKSRKTLKESNKEFYPLMIEFERKKILLKDQIRKKIEKYSKTGLDKSIFDIQEGGYTLSFPPSLLVEAFDELLSKTIHTTLSEMKKQFKFHKIDDSDDKRFKIVMVGGFSDFYLTQKAVKSFFGSFTDSDKRFEDVLTAEETALAISRGAALIANEQMSIEMVYPMTVGIIAAKVDKEGFLQTMHKPIFLRGEKAQTEKIMYMNEKITGIGKIPLYIDDGEKTYKLIIDKKLNDLFPNQHIDSNHWKLGIRMDHNSFYYIYVVDKYGKNFKHELGNLIEKYKDTLILE